MSLIALSGYANSGKDLVGRMIQTLMCPNVFGMSDGHILQIIKDYDTQQWWIEEQSGWEIKKFAGKLKQIASILTGIPIEKFEDQEFKKTHLGPEWSTCVEAMPFADLKKTNMELKMTVREFMQKLGTDALRDQIHPNVWINALFADYTGVHTDHVLGGFEYPNWVITDCRFPNEAQAVKKHKGIIIRVNRPGTEPVNAHPSETALDDWNYDDVITNSGSVEHLLAEVRRVLKEQTILV